MVVDVIEQIEADAADGLLPHHGLVENPRQNVRYDRARVFHSLAHRHLAGVNTTFHLYDIFPITIYLTTIFSIAHLIFIPACSYARAPRSTAGCRAPPGRRR